MIFDIITTDDKTFTLTQKLINECILFYDIIRLIEPPSLSLKILVPSDIFQIIINFSEINTVIVPEDYDVTQIVFPTAVYEFIYNLEFKTINEVCCAANYLYYPVLLELCCKVIATKLQKIENMNGSVPSEFVWISSDDEL